MVIGVVAISLFAACVIYGYRRELQYSLGLYFAPAEEINSQQHTVPTVPPLGRAGLRGLRTRQLAGRFRQRV